MGLTRPRAHQLQDIDYKQTARVITTDNVTLSGGAPATVDGTSLALTNRVLVTAQTTGTENGIYEVTVVGSGSNGTWVRTEDANATGDIKGGTIIMITEGTVYADTQWKLTTDNPITIGSTALTFARNGNAAFGVIAVSGQSDLVSDQIGDTLTLVAGTNLALTNNAGTDTLTLTPSLTPAITSLTATGNISAGNLAATGSVTTAGMTSSGDVVINSDGQSSGGACLQIDNTNTTNAFPKAIEAFNANLGVGSKHQILLGKDGSTNDTGIISFNYAGDASSSNTIQLGLWGSGSTFNVTGGGNVGIGTTSPDAKLEIENTSTDDALLLTTTESSSTAGPVLTLKRNSASPADADYLGQLKFKGENDADQEVVYAKITGKIQDASDGTEDGLIEFTNSKAGSNNITARLRSDSLQLLNDTSLTVAGSATVTGNVLVEGTSAVQFYDTDSSNFIGFKAPGTVTTNVTYTLPADGSNEQVLQTNGNGTLSFVDQSGGGSGSGDSFPNSSVTPLPSSEGNFDLAKQYDQTGSVETPFETGATDAFGVSLGQIYTMMDPVGSTLSPTDLGVLS
jgi:hypothetical protein|tara:strand:+ start:3623 stop:5326 length:1704 start_codon:yes stop_codon:yes gene_type:complete